jgi:hypothetical protein
MVSLRRIGNVIRTKDAVKAILFAASLLNLVPVFAQSQSAKVLVSGTVLDPARLALAGAHVEFDLASGKQLSTTTDANGRFALQLPASVDYTVHIEASGFAALSRHAVLNNAGMELTLRLERVASVNQEVVVSGSIGAIDLDNPDPSQKVLVREELLDANPGRPGAPISIPGMPIETASDGRLQLGLDGMIARGYTGQTTETFAPGWQAGNPPPSCSAGIDGVANDFDCGSTERAVGIRMISWVGGSISYRFGNGK